MLNKVKSRKAGKIIKPLIVLLCGVVILSGCKKNNSELPVPKLKDVYVAGAEVNSRQSNGQAIYWKNGEKILLPTDGNFSEAKSIFVTDDAVYVAGYDELHGAVYWKNGTKVILSDANSRSNTTDIFISGNDVYVSGYTRQPATSNYEIACYWKNGVKQTLGITDNHSRTEEILVNGTDVYVTGYQQGTGLFRGYWKNGVPVNLNTNQYEAVVSSLFMSGNDLYVAGQTNVNGRGKACYWKNGILISLHDETLNINSQVFDIYVKDNVVYAVGAEYHSGGTAPVYWVNGVKKILPNLAGAYLDANCIAVSGNDIYIAGGGWGQGIGNDNKAFLWKNEERIELPHSPLFGEAVAIFIK
jgi:hypothetical protein